MTRTTGEPLLLPLPRIAGHLSLGGMNLVYAATILVVRADTIYPYRVRAAMDTYT